VGSRILSRYPRLLHRQWSFSSTSSQNGSAGLANLGDCQVLGAFVNELRTERKSQGFYPSKVECQGKTPLGAGIRNQEIPLGSLVRRHCLRTKRPQKPLRKNDRWRLFRWCETSWVELQGAQTGRTAGGQSNRAAKRKSVQLRAMRDIVAPSRILPLRCLLAKHRDYTNNPANLPCVEAFAVVFMNEPSSSRVEYGLIFRRKMGWSVS
jgi:hypothetical protein